MPNTYVMYVLVVVSVIPNTEKMFMVALDLAMLT